MKYVTRNIVVNSTIEGKSDYEQTKTISFALALQYATMVGNKLKLLYKIQNKKNQHAIS